MFKRAFAYTSHILSWGGEEAERAPFNDPFRSMNRMLKERSGFPVRVLRGEMDAGRLLAVIVTERGEKLRVTATTWMPDKSVTISSG